MSRKLSDLRPDVRAKCEAMLAACDAEVAKLRALQGWVNGLE